MTIATEFQMKLLGDELAGELREENDGIRDPDKVATSVMCEILDKATGKSKGYSRQHHFLTIRDVATRIKKKLDLTICRHCGWERPRKTDDCCSPCDKCGAETEWLIDEYLGYLSDGDRHAADKPCGPYWRIIAFSVTGGSEGHYYHVGTISQGRGLDDPSVWTGWLIGKTFAGMERANEMVARIQKLLDL